MDNGNKNQENNKKYLHTTDVEAATVLMLKENKEQMKNQSQFGFCMCAAKKLDEIKHVIDSLNPELNITAKEYSIFIKYDKARGLASKHEETKRKKGLHKAKKLVLDCPNKTIKILLK